ncbi:MAG TPA: hypothetical protein PLE19_23955, partial [Planctomycetota bacterium]|nr:hypothetical protein [Planctomycetota bacterium]
MGSLRYQAHLAFRERAGEETQVSQAAGEELGAAEVGVAAWEKLGACPRIPVGCVAGVSGL